VAKTLQGMIDEKAEREEQDAAALRYSSVQPCSTRWRIEA
jgi:hypothetical protein